LRHNGPFAKDTDFVFPSIRLKGKKPLSASIVVQKYLRPGAVKAGVIKEGDEVRFGFHNVLADFAKSRDAPAHLRGGTASISSARVFLKLFTLSSAPLKCPSRTTTRS
jgi:hypothetical protein